LAIAIEFERLAKVDVSPSDGLAGASAMYMYIADVGAGGASSRYECAAVQLGGAVSGGISWKLDAELRATYDDEPRDAVFFEALAAGKLSVTGEDTDVPTPKTRIQALSGKWSDQWIASEKREWDGLWEKGAFEDVPYEGQRLQHMMWVYKVKSDGTLKSRLVADGRHQDPTTYSETAFAYDEDYVV
jgi:hypothetical protein